MRTPLLRRATLAFVLLVLAACGKGGDAKKDPGAAPVDLHRPPAVEAPVSDRVVVLILSGFDPALAERWSSDLPGVQRLAPGRHLPRLRIEAPATARHTASQLVTGTRGDRAGVLGGAALDPASLAVIPERLAPGSTLPPFWVLAAQAGIPTRALWTPGGLPDQDLPGLTVVPAALAAPVPAGAVVLLTPGALAPAGRDAGPTVQLQGDPPWKAEVPLGNGASWQIEISALGPEEWRLVLGSVRADVRLGEVGMPVSLPLPAEAGGGAVQVRAAAVRSGEGVVLCLLSPGRDAASGVPLTRPASFAQEWRRYYGPVDTTGGAQGIFRALRADLATPDRLVREIDDELAARQDALLGELGRHDAQLVVAWLPEAGLAGEAFLGLADSGHPGWTGERAVRFGGSSKSAYAELDRVVQATRQALDPSDRLIVVSDHGVESARYLVDLNAVLAKDGLLALRPDVDRASSPTLDQAIRWDRTTAYAVGPGLVYLNQVGREAQGTVTDGARAATLAKVRKLVEGLKAGKASLVAEVLDGATAFPNAPEGRRPDLVVRFAPTVATAPNTMAGRIGAEPVAPNRGAITGTPRGTDGAQGAGMVMSSFGDPGPESELADVAPTVLTLLGVPLPDWMDGHPWPVVQDASASPSKP